MTVIRQILGCAFILSGILLFIIETIGVYKFDYVLNRMHATAIGDSLGILMVMIGGSLLIWEAFAVLKMLVLLIAMYITGPVSTHLIARVEALTNNHLEAYLDKPITEKNNTLKGE